MTLLDGADLLRTYALAVDDVDETGRRAHMRIVPFGVVSTVADNWDNRAKGLSRRPYREGWKLGAFRHAVKAANRVPFVVGVAGGHDARRNNPFADVGPMRDLVERDDALYGEVLLDRSPFGEHTLAKIATGQWRGVSIGATALKWQDDGDPFNGGTRWRTLASLDHVLLTDEPAIKSAEVLAVRETVDTPRLTYWQGRYPTATMPGIRDTP